MDAESAPKLLGFNLISLYREQSFAPVNKASPWQKVATEVK